MERVDLAAVRVHPVVASIFRSNEAQESAGRFVQLSVTALSKLQVTAPFHAVKSPKKVGEFLCFAGLQLLQPLRQADLKSAWIVVHEGLSDDEIFEHAWLHEIHRHLQSPHRNSVLASMHEIINLAPKTQRRLLLAECKSASAMTLTQQLTGETRAAVRNQFVASASVESTLEKLLRD